MLVNFINTIDYKYQYYHRLNKTYLTIFDSVVLQHSLTILTNLLNIQFSNTN